MLLLAATALFLFTNEINGQQIHSVAGPFRIIPDHIEHCPASFFKEEQSDWYFRGIRDRHNKDVWHYFGNYTTKFAFDDNLNVEMVMSSWSSRGGWKENAQVLKFQKFCTTGKTYLPKLWKILMFAIHNSSEADCPFPPGFYRLTNAKADLSINAVPVFFYGKWRLDFKITNIVWECISCMRIFLETVPKLQYGSQFGAAEALDPSHAVS